MTDSEIELALNNKELLSDTASYNRTLIHPASLDLSVGTIYVPGTDADKPGGINSPRSQHSLSEGGTAVVETAEEIMLAPNQLGIVFLPSGDSSKGLLTTNPGLVDPGYKGKLHLTLINMGKNPFEISKGKRIIRIVIFELNSAAHSPVTGNGSAISAELLDRLSHDFLSIDQRIEKEVTRQDIRTRRWQVYIPLLLGLAAIISTTGGIIVSNSASEDKFGLRITKIEQQISDEKGESKISSEISDINSRLKDLEIKTKMQVESRTRP
ncbi:dCTP deaminase domain-containing protein [Paraburkholderia sediminicola]|uniref:dCTP deaminase domain-containing protein n=1 Tax=Paraburkholderia sediminicola TaxID=458836 RepID=UPI0038BC1E54